VTDHEHLHAFFAGFRDAFRAAAERQSADNFQRVIANELVDIEIVEFARNAGAVDGRKSRFGVRKRAGANSVALRTAFLNDQRIHGELRFRLPMPFEMNAVRQKELQHLLELFGSGWG